MADNETRRPAPEGLAGAATAGPLAGRIAIVPAADPGAAAAALTEARGWLAAAGLDSFAEDLSQGDRVAAFVGNVLAASPHLRDLVRIDPPRLERALAVDPADLVDGLVASCAEPQPNEAALMRHLRRLKQQAALIVGLADLAGAWDVATVTAALTRFADAAVEAAVAHLLGEAARQGKLAPPDPAVPSRGSGYVVLAMGKHGGFELNYSSDIDLIVLFEPRRAYRGDPDEAATFFVKITKRLVRILQERTADGYVFRTDLRLRPDPGATAVAISIDAALVYYESVGQNWERAALIKARPCAGDVAEGEAFLAEIAPFIWRKSFDYAAIADVHAIKRQIHAVKGHGQIAVAGHNVKLGRGGIREIEFFVQTQQLIAGGREPRLRGRSTRKMLAMLVELGWIEPKVRDQLDAAYAFLRALEHRLQMIADEQTHTLPRDPAGLLTVARLMGYADLDGFEAALRHHLERVQRHYARLFEDAPALSGDVGSLVFTGGDDDPDTLATLSGLGFRDPAQAIHTVREWHFGRYPATRSAKARERLTEIVPAILAAFGRLDNPDAALAVFDRLVAQLPAGVQLFSLLRSNPNLLDLIGLVIDAAPRLAHTISRRPRVLDALLDPAFFGTLPDADELQTRLAAFLAEARGYEERLDRARIFGQEQAFLVGVRVLTGTIAPVEAGIAYATLADVVVAALLASAEAELVRAHGRVPGGAVIVMALGKLGGCEMTAASDLDLILLYDHDPAAEASDGAKPLAPSQYYARLTQRLVAALSAPTGEGRLYEVDFRLRPSGNSGPLATRIAAFEHYQREEAWTWEHMALTRARPVAGDRALAVRAEATIRQVLTRPRDVAVLAADVIAMRRRIAAEKGTDDPFEVKQVAGGLVDLEFVAQYLMLAAAAHDPTVLATGTEIALDRLFAAGLLPAAEADVLRPACRLYQALTQILRLAVEGKFKPQDAPKGVLALLARAGGAPDFERLAVVLRDTEAAVRASFERLVGPIEAPG